jgi:hypothetical protein
MRSSGKTFTPIFSTLLTDEFGHYYTHHAYMFVALRLPADFTLEWGRPLGNCPAATKFHVASLYR